MNNLLLTKIKKIRDERDWKQFHLSKNLALSLVLEATEVLELYQWTKDNNLPKEKAQELSDEIADVYYWLLLLADEHNIDMDKALEEKLKVNIQKYPVSKSKGSSKKYTEL